MKVYLSISEFAAAVGISTGYAKNLRHRGLMPTPDAMIGPYDGWTPATATEFRRRRAAEKVRSAK